MEPSQLQLLLNIVTITGVVSLAGYCYLLKKENRRLAARKEVPKGGVVEAVFHLPSRAPAATPAATPVTTSITAARGHPQLRCRPHGRDG